MSRRRGVVAAFAIGACALAIGGDSARADAPRAGGLVGGPGSSAALALAGLDRKIADLDAQETNGKREIELVGARIAETHARVIARGRAFYRATRAGMLPIGGGFEALVEHAMHVERMRHGISSDIQAERDLRTHAVDVSHALERIARDRVALEGQRAAMDAERVAIEDDARRQQAFDRAFETSTGASDYGAVNGGGGVAADLTATVGFAASRGRLLFPVAGRAETRPAHREGTTGPGLEVHAPVGAVVRSVYAGRVAFADRYGPYGKIVIVDHGDHYYSVSGNLGTTDVRVGDEVTPGERLGTVGDDGQGAMLYFEIRHGTETLSPGAWLGLP